MSDNMPGRNPINSVGEAQEIAHTNQKFYLIKWRLLENSMGALQPVDFTPLGPYIIDEIYGEGADTCIRVEQLRCNMRIWDFYKKFGGMFESPEHIQAYKLRLRWIEDTLQECLAHLKIVRQQAEEVFAEEELSPEVRSAMEEKRGKIIQ